MANNAYFCQYLACLLIRRAIVAPPPHEAHARLAAATQTSFILESREGPKRMSRYSFVGANPAGRVTFDETLHVDGALPEPRDGEAPLSYLRRVQSKYHVHDHETPFIGGLVGSFGYDFVQELEASLKATLSDWPKFQLGLYLDALVYDHEQGTVHYVSRGEDRFDAWQATLAQPNSQGPLQVGPVACPVGDAAFRARVDAAKELIAAGENFQIVISRPFHAKFEGPLTALYEVIRRDQAVPYLFHVRFAGRELLGASPEMLVRVRSGQVETFPIAGTRPVTGDEATDTAAGTELLQDGKETAEHAMLVDLARNDVARNAQQVQVPEYQVVKQFSHVQHIVSQVTGTLRPDRDALDAFAGIFPAGTVSGAPKIRAMEHIARLETHARGPYAGAVAYLSFNGDLDSAITIRSISAQGGRLTIQAGAGIVLGSDSQAEAEETRHKAAAMRQALARFQTEEPA